MIFFHISAQNIDSGYSLEPPRWGGCNEYPQSIFSRRDKKNNVYPCVYPRWGGSNEYPQSMFLSRNKKNNVYPCKPHFYYIKVVFKGVKNWKISGEIFHISAQNIDSGYSLEPPQWGGSNEYPESIFSSRNKKNNVYPCKPHFYYIKVGFKEVKII